MIRFSYTYCSNKKEWNLLSSGEHSNCDIVKKNTNGIALIILDIFKQITEANSDLKAKQLLNIVTSKRHKNEKLVKEIELETLKNPKYIANQTPDLQ